MAGVTAFFVGETTACDDAGEELGAVWSEGRAEELARIFAEADAGDAWADARPKVDAYADAWLDAREAACEAALDGEPFSPAKLACLEQRKDALAAGLAVLAEASPTTTQRAYDVIAGLPPIEACFEDDALRMAPSPASDDEADDVDAIRSKVAEAEALRLAGKYDEAKPVAEAAVERAEKVAFVAVRAEARHVLGEVLADLGLYEDAKQSLEGAVSAAQASGHEEVLSKAAQRLGYVVGIRLGQIAAGEEWLQRAEAAALRRGNPPAEVADLAALRGTLLLAQGDTVPARSEFERALAHRREAKLPDDDRTAAYLTNLGAAYINSGLPEEGRERLAEAYEIRQRVLTKGHPRLVATAVNLAQAMTRTGDEEDAVALLRAVIDGGGLAKDHPKMVTLLLALGKAKAEAVIMGDPKEDFRAALALAARVLPEDSPTHVDVHSTLGALLLGLGERQAGADALPRRGGGGREGAWPGFEDRRQGAASPRRSRVHARHERRIRRARAARDEDRRRRTQADDPARADPRGVRAGHGQEQWRPGRAAGKEGLTKGYCVPGHS